jgi:uncharacterized membrane protein YuzA (DUF378 family)
LQVLALVSFNFHATGCNIGLVFFGPHCLVIGYLFGTSTFFHRILGPLLAIAGLCCLIKNFASFLAPSLVAYRYPYILLPGLARPSLALWPAVMGVDVQRWQEQAWILAASPGIV